ncbi:protein kinase [Aureococcus anophagefferens]|nr:protein kinase [Aureococcus anophagefferens]
MAALGLLLCAAGSQGAAAERVRALPARRQLNHNDDFDDGYWDDYDDGSWDDEDADESEDESDDEDADESEDESDDDVPYCADEGIYCGVDDDDNYVCDVDFCCGTPWDQDRTRTADPTPGPTPDPSAEPTPEPTPEPTLGPSPEPTPEPTPAPTAEPTFAPTFAPTASFLRITAFGDGWTCVAETRCELRWDYRGDADACATVAVSAVSSAGVETYSRTTANDGAAKSEVLADINADAYTVTIACTDDATIADSRDFQSSLVVVRRRRDAEKQEVFEDEATALEILKTEETKDIESYGARPRASSCTIAEFEVELRGVEASRSRGGQGTVHLAEYQGEAGARDHGRLRSPRIVAVLGVVTTDPTYLGLVLEYLPGGSLRDALDADGAIDAERQRVWSADVARGMAYLYKSRIEHRDLKSLNCLLTHDGRGKVCDFGLSKCDDLAATRATAGLCGTPAFMAPEYLDGGAFHEKCDVYSYAMVLYEIWTRGYPWEGLSPPQVIFKVVQRLRPEAPPSMPGDVRALMTACWAHDASVRPSFKDIVASLDASTPRLRTKGAWDHAPLLEGDAHVRPMRTYGAHGPEARSSPRNCCTGTPPLDPEPVLQRREREPRRRAKEAARPPPGLWAREHAVASDGNCQFRAIAHQLCGNDERHDAVRKRVVGQLTLEPERYAEFCMVEDAEDADFEACAAWATTASGATP